MLRIRRRLILLCILQVLFLTAIFGHPGKDPGKYRDISTQKDSTTHASLGSSSTLLPHYSKALRPGVDDGDLELQRDHKFGVYPGPLRVQKRTDPNTEKRPIGSDDELEGPPAKQPKTQDGPDSLYQNAAIRGEISSHNYGLSRMQAMSGSLSGQAPAPNTFKMIAQKERNPENAFDCPGQEFLTVLKMLDKVIKDRQKKCRPADYEFLSVFTNPAKPPPRIEMDVSLHNNYIGVSFGKFGARDYRPWEHLSLSATTVVPMILYKGYRYWADVMKFKTEEHPMRYISLYNIHNPDTITIVSEVHRRAKLPDGQSYLYTSTPSGEQDSMEAEIWNIIRGTDEIEACEKMLISHDAEFNFARVEEVYTYLSSAPDGGKSVSILLGVKGLTGSPKSPKPGPAGDVAWVIQELEGNGERPNIFRPIYNGAIEKGKKARKSLEEARMTALGLMLSGSEALRQPEDPPPFPNGYIIDYSWSGLQTFAFGDLLRSLTLREDSFATFGSDSKSKSIFQTISPSYRKVNLNEIVKSHVPPATLRLITSSSADDQHFSFRWPWETSVHVNQKLHDLLYHCWRIGSNEHDEPSLNMGPAKMRQYTALPPVALKYITIWGVEDPKTLIVLRLIYMSWGKSLEKFSFTFSELDDDEKEKWYAILGTPAILPIAEMCLSYMIGLRACNIAAIHLSFHRPLSISERAVTWSTNSVSILLELETTIDEQYIPLDESQKPQDQREKAWNRVKNFDISHDIEKHMTNPDIGDQESDPFEEFGAPTLLLPEMDAEFERTKLDLSYSVIGYPSLKIVGNPFLSTLRQRVHYIPSGGPSYTQIQTTQRLELDGAENYKILYDTALSSQEKHLLFVGYQVQKKRDTKGKGKAKVGDDDEEFVEGVLDEDAEGWVRSQFGTILFATWFSQEGWSRISRITFQTLDSRTITTLGVSPTPENPTIAWRSDTPATWDQQLELFYATREGSAVKYFLDKKREFLTSSTIKALHIGIHADDPARCFIYVDFGSRAFISEQVIEMGDEYTWQPTFGEGKSTLQTSFLRGTKARSIERMRRIIDSTWTGDTGYSHDTKMNRKHLEKYIITPHEPLDNIRENHIITYLQEKGRLAEVTEGFRQDFLEENLKDGFESLSLRERGPRNLNFVFAKSSANLGHLVLRSSDLAEKGAGDTASNTINYLSDAIYAAWVHDEPVRTPMYKGQYLTVGGIRVLTILQVLPETSLILEQLYQIYHGLVRDGVLTLENPLKGYLRAQQYISKGQVAAGIAYFEKLWVSLVGIVEITSLVNMFPKFRTHMNRRVWIGYVRISTIVVRRTEYEGAPIFQMIVTLQSHQRSRGKTRDQPGPEEISIGMFDDRLVRLASIRGDELWTLLTLNLSGDKIDGEIDTSLFDILGEDPLGESSDLLAYIRDWIQVASQNLESLFMAINAQARVIGSSPRRTKQVTWGRMRLLPSFSGQRSEDFSTMRIRHRAEDIACQIVVGYSDVAVTGPKGSLPHELFAAILVGELIGVDSEDSDGAFYRHVDILADILLIAWRKTKLLGHDIGNIIFDGVSKSTATTLAAFMNALPPFPRYPINPSSDMEPRGFILLEHRFQSNLMSIWIGGTLKNSLMWSALLSSLEIMAVLRMLYRFPQETGLKRIHAIAVHEDPKLNKMRLVLSLQEDHTARDYVGKEEGGEEEGGEEEGGEEEGGEEEGGEEEGGEEEGGEGGSSSQKTDKKKGKETGKKKGKDGQEDGQ
ncbi:hypothetical protein TWF506_003514 [Arthrobotrys conoides]|uniref:Uncharacterized protein n=1 Tax=Arthrobotrys conoides TaxID=74498 RepID=A0AAN8RIU8_9PEZI